jgi:hypothetical protein
MNKRQKLEKLYSFKGMDKYAVFGKAQPGIINANEDQQQIINDILDNCCKELVIEIESVQKPTKSSLKDIITKCMQNIANAEVNTENKDFGYHLCYFLAEKTGLDIWRNSDTKIWGYWKIEDGIVKTVKRMRKSNK